MKHAIAKMMKTNQVTCKVTQRGDEVIITVTPQERRAAEHVLHVQGFAVPYIYSSATFVALHVRMFNYVR